jgi:hypothetical protein
MSDEIDREITTKKVTSNPNRSVEGYSVSEERTTRISNDNSGVGFILGVLLALGLGLGAAVYFLNNRPASTQIVPVPGPTTTIKEKTIEKNDTTIKEVAPATQQPTPKVEINVPAPAPITQPQTATTPVPTPAVTAQPQTPASTVQSQTATPTPAPVPAN